MSKPLIVAIASGKGGTGKTTIAVNLAAAFPDQAVYADCDVEEPNGHIFLQPAIDHVRSVGIPTPSVVKERCTGCGRCVQACRYNAIACIKGKVLVFAELCHGCGGCALVCPEHAISEVDRPIGVVETGHANGIGFAHGRLRVGAAMSPPLIRAVKNDAPKNKLIIIDAPPGTSCPVIAAMKGADFVVLVTEPTPFGLHDLMLAADTVRQIGIPFGVVINRSDIGDNRVAAYCRREQVPILLEIPDNRRVAEAYSRGELAVHAVPQMLPLFVDLERNIRRLADAAATREGRS